MASSRSSIMVKPAALALPISVGLHVTALAVAAVVTGFSSSLPHYHLEGGGPTAIEGTFAMADVTASRTFRLTLPRASEHGESLASTRTDVAATTLQVRRVQTSIESRVADVELPGQRIDCDCHAPEGPLQTPKRLADAPPEFVSSVAPTGSLRRRELAAPSAAIATAAMSVAADVALPAAGSARGNGGEAVDVLPRKIAANRKPPYPADAYARREEGRVTLEVHVNERGTVDTLRVVESSGFEALDQAALAAVTDWRFEPAQRGGRAVAAVVNVPVRFSIGS